jgi:hypothetical protein
MLSKISNFKFQIKKPKVSDLGLFFIYNSKD